MESRSRVTSFSERLYRTLLVVYPKEFRRQYSEQLVQAFGDLCREELEQHGKKGLLVLWMRTLGDLAVSVFSARSGIPLSSFSGVRVGGLIIMLGGALQFVAWCLFFRGIRFRPGPTSQSNLDGLTLSPGPTAFPLLAIGLLVLGISFVRRPLRSATWTRNLAVVGVILAALSAGASTARIIIDVAVKPHLPIAAGPPLSFGVEPLQEPFGVPGGVLTDSTLIPLLNILGHSEYWTLALSGVVLGEVLLLSGAIGRWSVLLPLMGLLAVPQAVGLLRVATFWSFIGVWDDFIVTSQRVAMRVNR